MLTDNRRVSALSSAPQIRLSWKTTAVWNTRVMRSELGRRIRAFAPKDMDFSLLFNHAASHDQQSIATIRFFSGYVQGEPTSGLVAVGENACSYLAGNFLFILPAFNDLFDGGAPQVAYGAVHSSRSFVEDYRVSKLVLRSKKLRVSRDEMEVYRRNPMLLAPLVPPLVHKGILEQARVLGLPEPELELDEIEVVEIGHVGAQPVDHANHSRAMLPRIAQLRVKMPIALVGEWAVGPLQTYGNGRVGRLLQEKHYRAEGGSGGLPPAPRSSFLGEEPDA